MNFFRLFISDEIKAADIPSYECYAVQQRTVMREYKEMLASCGKMKYDID